MTAYDARRSCTQVRRQTIGPGSVRSTATAVSSAPTSSPYTLAPSSPPAAFPTAGRSCSSGSPARRPRPLIGPPSGALAGQQRPPLDLVQSAPDAVWFANPQGVVQAGVANRALAADGLRPFFAHQPVRLGFELGRGEEDVGVRPSASRSQLPRLFVALVRHCSRLPRERYD